MFKTTKIVILREKLACEKARGRSTALPACKVLVQEAAALTIAATTGVAYLVGFGDGDKYNLTEYFLNLENGVSNISSIGIVDIFDEYPGGELRFGLL